MGTSKGRKDKEKEPLMFPLWKHLRPQLRQVVNEMDYFLREKGFALEHKGPWEWCKKHGWKWDCVALSQGRAEPYLNFSMEVQFPLKIFERDREDFAGHYVSRYRLPWFPSFLRQRAMGKLLEQLKRDIESRLGWFEVYSTPELCLKILAMPDSAIEGRCMANFGSEVYHLEKRYLQDVIEQKKMSTMS